MSVLLRSHQISQMTEQSEVATEAFCQIYRQNNEAV